jgi:hypothetical protein
MRGDLRSSRLSLGLLVSVFALCYEIVVIALPSKSPSSADSDPSFTRTPYHGLLHIGILTYPPSHRLLPNLMGAWGDAFLNSTFSGGMHLVTDAPQTVLTSIPTVISQKNLKFNASDRSWGWNQKPMVAKRIRSAEYFYFNTTAPWYILMTDNAFLFLENLREMLADLTRRWRAVEHSVVLGNCMSTSGQTFLQGGTGWLMSRKAVGNFLQISEKWFESTSTAEDVHFALAVKEMNVSIQEAASPYFLGQYLHIKDFDIMEFFNFERLRKCPNPVQILCRACKPFVAPFRKIVFFHHLSSTRIRRLPFPMSTYPENLGWFMCGDFPQFCLMD